MVYYVSIEGTIAAGKTTLQKALADALVQMGLNVVIAIEPVAQWKQKVGPNNSSLLEDFYSGKCTPFEFEKMCCETRIAEINKALNEAKSLNNAVVIGDRSPHWCFEPFAKLSLEAGKMTQDEFDELRKIATSVQMPNCFVYCWLDLKTSIVRQIERDASPINEEYLAKLYSAMWNGGCVDLEFDNSLSIDSDEYKSNLMTIVRHIMNNV